MENVTRGPVIEATKAVAALMTLMTTGSIIGPLSES
jgi:hypothetical protein